MATHVGSGWRRAATALLGAVVLLLWAGAVGAQEVADHEITWAHAAPGELDGFVVFVSPVEGSLDDARQFDVGLPQSRPEGSLQIYSAIISASVDEFVAVAAIDSRGRMSGLSAWSGLPPSPPGRPFLIGP